MTNDTHVRMARGGAMLILWWQWAYPDERLDLRGADLSGVDLSDALLESCGVPDHLIRDADATSEG